MTNPILELPLSLGDPPSNASLFVHAVIGSEQSDHPCTLGLTWSDVPFLQTRLTTNCSDNGHAKE
jgi:hypothetical protein